jgi:hypothetical protein
MQAYKIATYPQGCTSLFEWYKKIISNIKMPWLLNNTCTSQLIPC